MITKKKLAEQVLRLLKPSLTDDYKIDKREVMLALSQVRDNYIVNLFWQNYKLDNKTISGHLLSKIEQVVVQDDKCGEVYVPFNKRVIELHGERGIAEVILNDGTRQQVLYPMGHGHRHLSANSSISHLDKRSYIHEDGKLILFNPNFVGGKLIIYAAIASDELTEDENFPIPAGIELDIIKSTVEMIMLNRDIPQDVVNNNISE